MPLLSVHFSGEVFEWRGPAPFYFVAVPKAEAEAIKGVARLVTYGWGVVPVTVEIDGHRITTALFPKDGGYFVPLKDKIRTPAKIGVGDTVHVSLTISDG